MDKDRYIGRLLDGRYEILEVIGTGGMAVVYKARCHRLNRLVAIKILKDDYLQDEEFRNRFHAEGQAVAMLSHPNIVSVYDVSSATDADYIVMELIDGITLKQYMEKKGVLNWKETLHFAIQIAKALEHAHGRGIVHRDIKPHNVMVLKNGSVKVADFGIARVMSNSNTLTKEALGSVHYISPEQAKGGRVDNRSDIYSLGIVMYEMIAGRVPYDGESPVAVAIQHINGGAMAPSQLNPNTPAGLEQIILKAMCLAPADRYPTATAMLYDMDEFRKDPEGFVAPIAAAVDDATRALPTNLAQEAAQQPKTIAQRTAAEKTEQSVQRQKPAKPQKTKPRTEGKRSRVETIAIVSCVVGAVVALIVLMVVLMSQGGGGGGSSQPSKVRVPNLLGQRIENLPDYKDVEIRVQSEENSSEYEKGQIMYQHPQAGDEVVSGTKVFVTVSLGAEAPVRTMEDLVNTKYEEAERFLNGLEMDLHIIPREEHSSEIPVGNVIRTEPAKGEVLNEGQSVRIWVSTGPEVIMEPVPNVVGMNVDKAIEVLKSNGFHNVRQNPKDDARPAGEVVNQSENKHEKIDVNTLIILDVSTGVSEIPTLPPETPDVPDVPTTQPTQPVIPDGMEQLDYAFVIPNSTTSYELSIKAGDQWYVKEMTIQPGATSVTIRLTGSGTVTYELYINWTPEDPGYGEYYKSETVVFDLDD